MPFLRIRGRSLNIGAAISRLAGTLGGRWLRCTLSMREPRRMGQRRIHFAGRLRLTARRYLAMIGLGWGMHEDSAMTEVGSMAAGRAADRGSVSGYSADSARSSSSASSSSSRSDSPNSSSSRSDSGSFGEGSMAAARAADRASVGSLRACGGDDFHRAVKIFRMVVISGQRLAGGRTGPMARSGVFETDRTASPSAHALYTTWRTSMYSARKPASQ